MVIKSISQFPILFPSVARTHIPKEIIEYGAEILLVTPNLTSVGVSMILSISIYMAAKCGQWV